MLDANEILGSKKIPTFKEAPEKLNLKASPRQIEAKIAAYEIWRLIQEQKKYMLISIAGFFVVALCTIFNPSIGGAAALVFTALTGWYLWRKLAYANYLQTKYYLKG